MKSRMNWKERNKGKLPSDIITLILDDHKPLKKLIKTLKGDGNFSQKKTAFEEFAPLLIAHAKPEEQVLYVAMKQEKGLRAEGFEGDTEHSIADQLVEKAKRTGDKDLWMAQVKVLAELVEHHIEEEEKELLPDYKKNSDIEARSELGGKYAVLREEILAHGHEEPPKQKNGQAVFRARPLSMKHHKSATVASHPSR